MNAVYLVFVPADVVVMLDRLMYVWSLDSTCPVVPQFWLLEIAWFRESPGLPYICPAKSVTIRLDAAYAFKGSE